jgi:hypothetical protein
VGGHLPSVMVALRDADIKSTDFVKILFVKGAITTVANSHLPSVMVTLHDADIKSTDFFKILCVDGAITAVDNGHMPAVMTALCAAGIESKVCMMIVDSVTTENNNVLYQCPLS